MKNSLLICDEANSLTKESTNIIFWKRVEIRNKSEKNIYELIEKDPSYYKNKYLEFPRKYFPSQHPNNMIFFFLI